MKQLKRWIMLGALVLAAVLLAPAGAQAQEDGRLDGAGAAQFRGAAAEDEAGWSVAGAGDVNGDGYDDFLVGARYYDDGGTLDAGAAYLILGNPAGWGVAKPLDQSPIIQYTGEAADDQAGLSVAGAGDVNGDGYDDFLVGAPGYDDGGNNEAGAAYLVLGSANPGGGSLGTAGARYVGEAATDYAGASNGVAGAGDVDGDGYDDFLVGSYSNDNSGGNSAGAVYLVRGSDSGLNGGSLGDTNIALRYVGETFADFAGQSVAGAGDVNGDGYDDFLVGASGYDGVAADSGIAYLVLGSSSPGGGSLGTEAISFPGASGDDGAGVSVSGIGDVNGDGYDDFLVGAPLNGVGGDEAGAVHLVLGVASPSGTNLGGLPTYNGQAFEQVGQSVTGAGDVNGDGYDDFLVGAPFSGDFDEGAAYLVLGTSLMPSGDTTLATEAVRYLGASPSAAAGASVAGAGDANGDGYSDVLVGAPGNSEGGTLAGAAYLVTGEGDARSFLHRSQLSGSGDVLPAAFPQAKVTVDVTAGAQADGDVSVIRHLRHPCTTDRNLVMPIWTVASAKVSGTSATDLHFRYPEAAVADLADESTLAVWSRPAGADCGEWTQVGGSTVDAGTNTVSVNVSDLNRQYTLAAGQPSPTALETMPMGVRLAQEPLWLVLLLSALVLATGATYWVMRRQAAAVSLGE